MANPEPTEIKRPNLNELLSGGNLISPEELAAGLRVARVTIYGWVRRGLIPHLKLEGLVRFDPEEVHTWLEAKRRMAWKAPGCGRTI